MWFFIAVLVVLWLIGFISFGAGAYWVHILLIAAFILLVNNIVRARKRAV